VIGAAFAAIARTGSPHERGLAGAWGALGYLNVLLAMFNLIPAFPLDGGRMLRSALWAARKNRRWATHWAAVTGRGFAAALMAGGVASIAFPSVRGNAWGAVIIGAFLFGVASSADRNAHDTDDEERTP
jgi:Zn-dependent protease